MRRVISTNASPEVSDDYADQVRELLDSPKGLRGAADLHRETTQKNRYGQADFHLRVYSYPAPGSGEETWAVDYSDPASREVEECASQAEAEAHYEEQVRFAATNLGWDREGNEQRFATSDVDGVPVED